MKKIISAKKIHEFQELVYLQAKQRSTNFPWRKNISPYRVLVSEIMLQQTQVSRASEKFKEFIALFPTPETLASAPQSQVLSVWQGMGYNRRAIMLKRSAEVICNDFEGKIPCDEQLLKSLPGIGPYTASAIIAFAFNKPTLVLETNIRRVFIHHFFQDKKEVNDKELFPFIQETLDSENPRAWYSALMDYGALLKTQIKNPNQRSAHYTKQSKFIGSLRQIRGQIIKELLEKRKLKVSKFCKTSGFSKENVEKALIGLKNEDFLEQKGAEYYLK
jgi:A/G-specific adenine glycosylase